MKCLVTGAAGFIGSHLCQKLLDKGYPVLGIDSFSDFYPRWIKEHNIHSLLKEKNFEFIAEDVNRLELEEILESVDYVFHLAAQAGVRTSWGEGFAVYTKDNIEATQKLLEASTKSPIHRFIFASSSSVYGACPELPMAETSPLHPFSPYGVTKLAAEQLCFLYWKNHGVPILSLRFFTVYGPRQRPDMAFHKFFKAISEGKPISIFGDGRQTRDFTYIDDVVQAITASLDKGQVGEIYNIGGGNRRPLENILPLLEDICQKRVEIKWEEHQKGDVPHTYAKIKKAKRDLGFSPAVDLNDGLREEWIWLQNLYSS